MIRVSQEAIRGAAERVGRVSGDLGCGTPLGRVAGAADETLLLALRTDREAAH